MFFLRRTNQIMSAPYPSYRQLQFVSSSDPISRRKDLVIPLVSERNCGKAGDKIRLLIASTWLLLDQVLRRNYIYLSHWYLLKKY